MGTPGTARSRRLTKASHRHTYDYHYFWLRHNCDSIPRCRHPKTLERLVDSSEVPMTIKPTSARLDGANLHVEWQESPAHASVFSLPWLVQHAYGTDRKVRSFVLGFLVADRHLGRPQRARPMTCAWSRSTIHPSLSPTARLTRATFPRARSAFAAPVRSSCATAASTPRRSCAQAWLIDLVLTFFQ